eukprot:UN03014
MFSFAGYYPTQLCFQIKTESDVAVSFNNYKYFRSLNTAAANHDSDSGSDGESIEESVSLSPRPAAASNGDSSNTNIFGLKSGGETLGVYIWLLVFVAIIVLFVVGYEENKTK